MLGRVILAPRDLKVDVTWHTWEEAQFTEVLPYLSEIELRLGENRGTRWLTGADDDITYTLFVPDEVTNERLSELGSWPPVQE